MLLCLIQSKEPTGQRDECSHFIDFVKRSSLIEDHLPFTNQPPGWSFDQLSLPQKQGPLTHPQPLPRLSEIVTEQKVLQVPFLLGKIHPPHSQRGSLRSAKLGAISKSSLVLSLPVEVERSGSKLKPQLLHLPPQTTSDPKRRLLPFPPLQSCKRRWVVLS